MPLDIAYPLGGPGGDFKYFFLQIHYQQFNDLNNKAIQNGNVYNFLFYLLFYFS